jgi:hypothetical protein
MKKIILIAWLLASAAVAAPRGFANADIAGGWSVEFSGGDVQSEADMQMFVKQDDSRLTGYVVWNASANDFPLKGTITDDHFVIVWSSRVNATVTEITFKGTVKGDEIYGTAEIPGRETGELYAKRTGR